MRKMTLLAFALFVGVFASAAPAKKRTAKDAAVSYTHLTLPTIA